MKPQNPLNPLQNHPDRQTSWSFEKLPAGLLIARLKESRDQLDIPLPSVEGSGLALTCIQYKGDLQIAVNAARDRVEQASPGLALLSRSDQPFAFRSESPVTISAVSLFIPADWIGLFLKENAHFKKIEQLLENQENIITCRLGRRQLSMFTEILGYKRESKNGLLGMQNNGLGLLEYFLCNRHRSLLGVYSSSGIDNEDDLSLIREVESYISEYYCSDSFTVDSILKKTYTSYHRLNFLFKSIHGMTISEYIRNKRIQKSKEMIADNVKSISQIAYEIGYSSISNYILAFKKIYQITPGKYKKQIDSLA
jgi:AraC-like DNA-binding protein